MRIFRRAILVFILFLLTAGFSLLAPSQQWPISPADPTLWVKFCQTLTFSENNLPENDPLYGTTLTFAALENSIFADIQSVNSSWVRLADADSDPNYQTTANASSRTIDVCFQHLQFGQGGHASPQGNGNGNGWNSCAIVISDSINSSASDFVATLTHELGHCLGLAHPMNTIHAIMSYFHAGDVVRLQLDDKMGLTYLYPVDSGMGKENFTYGISCAPR